MAHVDDFSNILMLQVFAKKESSFDCKLRIVEFLINLDSTWSIQSKCCSIGFVALTMSKLVAQIKSPFVRFDKSL